ncbi:nucleolar transcription factor 1-A-like [Ruditapes philippinarum]|uniref:nucleolar transcription factor 1-A-like n=1 Tax=Ruditapes philippinarum TaxID=129788 RepID=UPI00295C337D|nr:nucleolar transcription factor 1-A-like [Ruditapes philippinarum]
MTKELVSSGIKGVPLMLKLSTMWKELSEKERAKYNLKCAKQKEAYVKEVMEYSQAHPDDMEIKKILEDETHRKAKVSTSKKTTKTKEELESSELDDTMNTTMNDTGRTSTPLKTPKKKKRQHDDDSQDSSPTKSKKSKVRKVWTAEEMHFESKYADYKAEHPDMDDDVVRRKIASKFKRLSEEKIAKYKRKAEQRNDESD